jgi:glutamate racemase
MNQPIGIFDSGIGGLTVARALAHHLPHESILYFGDTARCPYGPRDLDEVQGFVRQIGRWLVNHEVKLIVIACNTATAAGLEAAQREFDIPIIGVVEPGARAAVQATRMRRVGVIGTVATVESGAYTRALRSLDAGITVFSAATPRFVEIAEEGLRVNRDVVADFLADESFISIDPAYQEIARDYLVPLRRCGIDTLVLGCTHFPLLRPLIESVMGPTVTIVSSAEESAIEIASTLERRGQNASSDHRAIYSFATTASDVGEFITLGSHIFGQEVAHVEQVGLDELAHLHTVRVQ